MKIGPQFLSNLVNTQTDRQTNKVKTSPLSAEVKSQLPRLQSFSTQLYPLPSDPSQRL